MSRVSGVYVVFSSRVCPGLFCIMMHLIRGIEGIKVKDTGQSLTLLCQVTCFSVKLGRGVFSLVDQGIILCLWVGH